MGVKKMTWRKRMNKGRRKRTLIRKTWMMIKTPSGWERRTKTQIVTRLLAIWPLC